jgi:hypothetical protein
MNQAQTVYYTFLLGSLAPLLASIIMLGLCSYTLWRRAQKSGSVESYRIRISTWLVIIGGGGGAFLLFMLGTGTFAILQMTPEQFLADYQEFLRTR